MAAQQRLITRLIEGRWTEHTKQHESEAKERAEIKKDIVELKIDVAEVKAKCEITSPWHGNGFGGRA